MYEEVGLTLVLAILNSVAELGNMPSVCVCVVLLLLFGGVMKKQKTWGPI